MQEIDHNSALYYRDKFLEENELNIDNAIDFSPGLIDELLEKYDNVCEYAEQCYCCCGMGQRCWTELNFCGNWGLTQESIIKNIKQFVDNCEDSICGTGRVFRKDCQGYTTIYIFARDTECQQDVIIDFGKRIF